MLEDLQAGSESSTGVAHFSMEMALEPNLPPMVPQYMQDAHGTEE